MIVEDMDTFEKAWLCVEPSLDPKFEITGRVHSKEDVLAMIGAGSAILFHHGRSAMLVALLPNDPIPSVNAWASGGKIKELVQHLYPEVEAWAKANGYKKIIGQGRRQWGAVITKMGFLPDQIIYSKDI